MKNGFTLIETIVVVSIFTIIMGLGTMINYGFLNNDIFISEKSIIVSVLEKSRNRSMNNVHGTPHGVCYLNSEYIIFYNRETCEPISPSDDVVASNKKIAQESDFTNNFPTILWTQISGTTTEQTIEVSDGRKSENIIINNEGTIFW